MFAKCLHFNFQLIFSPKTKNKKKRPKSLIYYGGSMWESNPPKKLLTPHAGFEDQRAHQDSSTPKLGTKSIIQQILTFFKHFLQFII